jgi:hypothetical protein
MSAPHSSVPIPLSNGSARPRRKPKPLPAAWRLAIHRGLAARNPYRPGSYVWILFEVSAGRPLLTRATARP